ncbi:hypothetical protein EIP91_002599 [Steccherinum ochraceum]|uniref:Uncharacterized protein n=1 Tax=Steccherinum ochraceum TaxID=92696 RepID=A0A4R0RX72_9APHY|nr:hypothetical protein EIP91_002599 [Steccherinum ochraceum]
MFTIFAIALALAAHVVPSLSAPLAWNNIDAISHPSGWAGIAERDSCPEGHCTRDLDRRALLTLLAREYLSTRTERYAGHLPPVDPDLERMYPLTPVNRRAPLFAGNSGAHRDSVPDPLGIPVAYY